MKRPAILLPPPGSIYAGARVQPRDGGPIGSLEKQIGRTLALDDHYEGWLETFPNGDEADDLAHNRLPVIAWNCRYSNASIAAGTHDADITTAANNIKAYGHLFFLRWFWEFNLNFFANSRLSCHDKATDLPNGYFSPTEFIAAWQHIHDLFAAQGVTNVVWLWCPSAGGNGPPASAYYPGDGYVDWLGFDVFATQNDERFIDTFTQMYRQMQAISTTLPILIAESAAKPSDQVTWMNGGDVTLQTAFPQVAGWMYFDVYKKGAPIDWVLTTTSPPPNGLTQFTTLVNTPYLSAMPMNP